MIELPPRADERGSVLIYIFIAVAVMAALSFAVSRGNREGLATIEQERAELYATQILDYVGVIRRATQTILINNARPEDLCFHTPRWGHNDYDPVPGAPFACPVTEHAVFDANGGGASFVVPTRDMLDVTFETQPLFGQWHFTGANGVQGVGSDGGGADSSELLMVLPYLKRDVCAAINKRMQNPNPQTIPTDDPDFHLGTPFAGTFTAVATLNTATLNGRRTGCFAANTTPINGSYVFYTVLVAR
jgi:hypothetical protein